MPGMVLNKLQYSKLKTSRYVADICFISVSTTHAQYLTFFLVETLTICEVILKENKLKSLNNFYQVALYTTFIFLVFSLYVIVYQFSFVVYGTT